MDGPGRGRVAHIVPTDRIAHYLLRARLGRLRQAGYDTTVLCGRAPTEGERDYTESLRSVGIEVIEVPFAREIAPLTDCRCARALCAAARRGGYDIVHSHNPKGGLLGPMATRLARGPAAVHTVHGFLFNESSRPLRRAAAMAAERWTAAWCDHLLFQSAEDHEYARQHRFKPAGRLHLIGNGVDEARFDPDLYPAGRQSRRAELGLGAEDLVVGMVGRLVREKGFEEYFAMAGEVARTHPRAHFLVVAIAEPEQSDAVDADALVRRHGLGGRCRVLEQRSDMPELYLAMDLAVLPSYREGIPRALMEASCMGLPVVATDIRGCREVVAHEETGLLYALGDQPAFLEAVERLLVSHELRARLGGAGRRRILEHFTEAITADRVVACYDGILAARTSGGRAR